MAPVASEPMVPPGWEITGEALAERDRMIQVSVAFDPLMIVLRNPDGSAHGTYEATPRVQGLSEAPVADFTSPTTSPIAIP